VAWRWLRRPRRRREVRHGSGAGGRGRVRRRTIALCFNPSELMCEGSRGTPPRVRIAVNGWRFPSTCPQGKCHRSTGQPEPRPPIGQPSTEPGCRDEPRQLCSGGVEQKWRSWRRTAALASATRKMTIFRRGVAESCRTSPWRRVSRMPVQQSDEIRLLHNFDALCEPDNCVFGRQIAVGANDRN
jgi:hypothetical protein